MQKQKRVLIGDTGDSFAVICADHFRRHSVWAKVCPQNHDCLIQAVHSEHPDMILLPDFELFFEFERFIHMVQQYSSAEITIFVHPESLCSHRLMKVKGIRLLPYPTERADLETMLTQKFGLKQGRKSERAIEIELKNEVSNFLYDIGIPANLRGFHYLRRAILIVYNDDMRATRMMTEIYPAVANCYQSTAQRVEHSIRHAITQAWNSADFNEVFAHRGMPSLQNRKPTNSELIACVVDHLHLRRDCLAE